MNYKIKLSSFLISIFLISIGAVTTIYIIENPIERNGLELMWVLPILGSIVAASIIRNSKRFGTGIGIYFFSIIILIKYIYVYFSQD